MGLSELLKEIRKISEDHNNTKDTESRKLVDKILNDTPKNDEEWLKLEDEIITFMASEASSEEKKEVSGYTEMVLMVCNGIRSKNNRD